MARKPKRDHIDAERAEVRLKQYARIAKLEGWPTLTLGILMVASLVNSSGRSSDAAYLFSTTTIWMALSNSALLFYDAEIHDATLRAVGGRRGAQEPSASLTGCSRAFPQIECISLTLWLDTPTPTRAPWPWHAPTRTTRSTPASRQSAQSSETRSSQKPPAEQRQLVAQPAQISYALAAVGKHHLRGP